MAGDTFPLNRTDKEQKRRVNVVCWTQLMPWQLHEFVKTKETTQETGRTRGTGEVVFII